MLPQNKLTKPPIPTRVPNSQNTQIHVVAAFAGNISIPYTPQSFLKVFPMIKSLSHECPQPADYAGFLFWQKPQSFFNYKSP